MAIFEEIRLRWDGREFVVTPDRVMACIAKIEDHITLVELKGYAERGTAPLGKLASAFAAVLRHAGARVTDEEVYAGMFRSGAMQTQCKVAIETLLLMMIPPQSLQDAVAGEDAPTGKVRAAAPSSRKRSR
jgi:hypothetical protein